jgi:NADPH:quinone reductase-like Zn-dependent oxidoreductase
VAAEGSSHAPIPIDVETHPRAHAMKAVVLSQPGAKPLSAAVRLDASAPLPKPSPGQALVRVVSSAANPVDVYIASGDFGGDGAKGKIMAGDLAGVVEEVVPVPAAPTSTSQTFKKGDRVWALTPYFAPSTAAAANNPKGGCWAEYAVADLAWLAPAPSEASSLPLSDAGAGPLVLLTAWQALEAALGPPLPEEGDNTTQPSPRRVLVTAAAGGVGHVCVQLAKNAWGCSVVGVAGQRNRDFVLHELGAEECVDYADEQAVKVALGEEEGKGGGFDAAVDLLGGAWTARLARCVAAKKGKVAHVMNRGTGEARLEELRKQAGEDRIATIFVKPDGAALARAARMIEGGKLKVVVAARFPLERAGEALEAVSGWHTRGKVVVTV